MVSRARFLYAAYRCGTCSFSDRLAIGLPHCSLRWVRFSMCGAGHFLESVLLSIRLIWTPSPSRCSRGCRAPHVPKCTVPRGRTFWCGVFLSVRVLLQPIG